MVGDGFYNGNCDGDGCWLVDVVNDSGINDSCWWLMMVDEDAYLLVVDDF